MPTWATSPAQFTNPHCQEWWHCAASLKEWAWLGWGDSLGLGGNFIHPCRAQPHCPAGPPTFTVLHLEGTQEKLRMTWEGNGISFLARHQRQGGSKAHDDSKRSYEGKLREENGSFSFSRPSQPQLRLSLRRENVVFLTFRSGVKLLNGVLSEGRNTTWGMKWQIAGFFLWIQRTGLKLLRTPISSFSFHRAFIKNLYPAWKMWEGDRVEAL